MNIENINAVANVIEATAYTTRSGSSGFNMASYIHSCGTPSCIAGWTIALKYATDDTTPLPAHLVNPPITEDGPSRGQLISAEAAEFLGLDPEAAEDLFLGWQPPTVLEDIIPDQAVKVLRHLAETGNVSWEEVGGVELW